MASCLLAAKREQRRYASADQHQWQRLRHRLNCDICREVQAGAREGRAGAVRPELFYRAVAAVSRVEAAFTIEGQTFWATHAGIGEDGGSKAKPVG